MKHVTRITLFIFFVMLAALAFPGQAFAQSSSSGDKVIFGDTYQLGPNETLNGNLTILGGAVTLEDQSQVTGDVASLGGALQINGTVDGNVSILGGSVSLGSSAVIHGDITSMGGTLSQSQGARVDGRVVNGKFSPFSLVFPRGLFNHNVFSNFFQPIGSIFGYIGNALLLAALAMLVMMFLPKPTERVAQAVMAQPVITGGLGLLSAVVIPVMLLLLTITIILIPATLVGILITAAAVLFGWIALGYEVGKRMAIAFKFHWHEALVAGLGTLVLSLVANGIGKVPCIGWVAPFLVGILGLGAVIITRFGSSRYPLPPDAGPITVTPSSPVVPPAPEAPSPVDQTSSRKENTPSQ